LGCLLKTDFSAHVFRFRCCNSDRAYLRAVAAERKGSGTAMVAKKYGRKRVKARC
jgi:hypothetical protein